MADEKFCKNCIYYRVDEEHWHDHYLIREHRYCIYQSKYKEEVEPNGYCENYQGETKEKSN